MAYGTSFQQLLQAVEEYYGAGSDQWVEIARYGTRAENFSKIIKQLPNYREVVSQSGKTLGYERFGSWNTSNPATVVNSNTQTGARTAVRTYTPATTGTNAQTGNVTANKGITASSGAQFITRSVIPAIAAAGVGIKLGKTIDSALYNANPDFWDKHGMSTLNPETWNDITTNDTALGTAFNMLFGLNPTNNTMQPYIDENAFAYLALYMQLNGMFNIGGTTVPDSIVTAWGVSNFPNVLRVTGGDAAYLAQEGGEPQTITNLGTHMIVYQTLGTNSYVYVMASANNFSGATAYTYDNKTVYYKVGGVSGPYIEILTPPVTVGRTTDHMTSTNLRHRCLAWAEIYGQTTPGLDGVGNQEGAKLPQLNNDMSLLDALNALKSQYPELWQDAVTYPVLQPDGTTTDYTYIPTTTPQVTGNTDTKPTGGNDVITQNQSYYDAATMPDDVWKRFWDVIDDETTDYDDSSGDGETPTPILPAGSASALWKIYNPSQSQLDAFGSWLWSSDFVDQILKLFNDPMQAIIGLHKIFVSPPISGSGAIKVGYLTSTASANYVSAQYVDVDCGNVNLDEYFGNVFDYEGTNVRLFLPFIGIVPLSVDDVMRGSINVKYHVDVLTGACLAEVSITRDLAGGILYTYSGNCAVQYPVSSGSYVGIVTGLLGIAGGIAGTIASGGALAPMLMGAGASVGRMHADVQHSGNISSNAGAMGVKKPYLIIERPQTKMPNNFETIEGVPSNSYVTLSNCTGYVKIKKTNLNGITATESEIQQINELLTNGIII